jgi:predicted aspartyl protease
VTLCPNHSSAPKLLSILLLSVAMAGPLPAADRQITLRSNTRPGPRYEVLTLARSRQNHLRVNAFVNGKPASLTIDTGCPHTFIASDRLAYFGLTRTPRDGKLPVKEVNGSFNQVATVHSLRLGSLDIVDVDVILATLAESRRTLRPQREKAADGILGADVLLQTRAILDCQDQVLILDRYPKSSRPRTAVWDFRDFSKTPVYVSDGLHLFVDTAINGTPTRLMVDTGAFATLLHRPFVRQLQIPVQETSIQSSAINVGMQEVDMARIQTLSVGLVNVMDKRVGVTDLADLIRSGLQETPPTVGLLGAEFLSRHHGIIDFGTRTLYLKPAPLRQPAPQANRGPSPSVAKRARQSQLTGD